MSNDPNTKNNKNSNLFDYSLDTVLNKEYDEFNKKINKNTKIMVLANTVLCIGIFQYFKRYHRSLFDKNRGIMRNFMSVLFHSFGSVFLIVLINMEKFNSLLRFKIMYKLYIFKKIKMILKLYKIIPE